MWTCPLFPFFVKCILHCPSYFHKSCRLKCARKVTLFFNRPFFNSASVMPNFLMNRASNVANLLLNIYSHHLPKLLSVFSIFVSFSIWSLSIWSIFHYHFHFHFNETYDSLKQTHFFSLHVKSSALWCCSVFTSCFANFIMMLPLKVLLIKKSVLNFEEAKSMI